MEEAIVFRGVHAIDPGSGLSGDVDVVIEKGLISRVGKGASEGIDGERVRIVAGAGLWLVPGFVDLHAHVREPGAESKEDVKSALAAAAAGGFTDICAMPNTKPVNDTRLITEWLLERARVAESARLHPISAITMGQLGESLTEMADLKDAGAVAASDDGRCVTRSDVMRRALEYARTFDLPIIQHCEDHALTDGAEMHEGAISTRLGLRGWPRIAEDTIVARDVILAEYTQSRYHVAHLSTLGAARIVREAKARGVKVTCEVTPHHLSFSHEMLLGYDTACKVNPPLREAEDIEALVNALADGTIDAVATDHAPHGALDKDCPMSDAAPGMIGLELCVPMLLELVRKDRLRAARMVEVLTSGPARVVGLPIPRIREGSRADLALIAPQETWLVDPKRLRTKSKNTPLLGKSVKGRVKATLCAGRFIHDEIGKPAGGVS